ncbi:hypothetical protein ZHAS_00008523 [Anopheles sinensis]|uniref:Uncharacterized protein n=1 Tax=Anopheles sinensis TaxID=74873 RepID=A0A084VSX5_ANOSI|nr:hypothetical protein ZHAS_00008523 [Anopheles sinensis]
MADYGKPLFWSRISDGDYPLPIVASPEPRGPETMTTTTTNNKELMSTFQTPEPGRNEINHHRAPIS